MTRENMHYEIRALMGKGMSRSQIARELNTRGIKTITGKAWTPNHVGGTIDHCKLTPIKSATDLKPSQPMPPTPLSSEYKHSKVIKDLCGMGYLDDSQKMRMLRAYFDSVSA